jgi:curli biogenesis system outer membrane secretion channel CsgG
MKTMRWESRLAILLALLTAMPTAVFAFRADDKKEQYVLPPYSGPKKRIAVSPMSVDNAAQGMWADYWKTIKSENNINTIDNVGLKMTEMLTTALIDTKRFTVLERAALDDTRSEIAIGKELGNEKTSVKAGNVLGAQIMVRAAVTEFQPHSKKGGGGISLGGISIGGKKDEAKIVLDVRFFDPSTSVIIDSVKAEGTSRSDAVGIGFSVGSLGVGGAQAKADPIEKATRDAIVKAVFKICERMAKVPWEARVAKVAEDGKVILNRGSNDGLKVGDALKLYKAGEIIEDPETGEKSRDEDVYVCDLTVSWVSEKLCRCILSGGKADPQVSYVVRYIEK